MLRPPRSPDEEKRLRLLQDLDILDSAPEEEFDRLTRLAVASFRTPVGLLSLVDRDREFFKSWVGWGEHDVDRLFSFCTHTLGCTAPMVVEDATLDERFRDNPLVTDEPHIRFYAGAPLRTREGYDLGALCVIDTKPRPAPTGEELAVLVDLADTATLLIEQRRISARLSEELRWRGAAEQQLAAGKAEAEAANAAMREFFSKMSHDLRTPLGVILGFTQFLRDADLTDDQKRDVEEIHQAGRNMLELVDGLLKAARENTATGFTDAAR